MIKFAEKLRIKEKKLHWILIIMYSKFFTVEIMKFLIMKYFLFFILIHDKQKIQ